MTLFRRPINVNMVKFVREMSFQDLTISVGDYLHFQWTPKAAMSRGPACFEVIRQLVAPCRTGSDANAKAFTTSGLSCEVRSSEFEAAQGQRRQRPAEYGPLQPCPGRGPGGREWPGGCESFDRKCGESSWKETVPLPWSQHTLQAAQITGAQGKVHCIPLQIAPITGGWQMLPRSPKLPRSWLSGANLKDTSCCCALLRAAARCGSTVSLSRAHFQHSTDVACLRMCQSARCAQSVRRLRSGLSVDSDSVISREQLPEAKTLQVCVP